MPRPKGSKNKKTVQSVVKVEEKIAAQQALKKTLEAEQADILAAIEKQKQLLKAKKKELRAAEKALLGLEAKKAEAAAVESAAAQKVEIEKVVSKLVSSGKSADEILEMLKK